MKLKHAVLFAVLFSAFCSGCVSRTVTKEKGFGDPVTEKKMIWVWQDEFRNP